MKKATIVFFLFFKFFQSSGQNTIGIPDIINYSKEDYNAGTQNRGIVQDKNGVIYFANQEGLLTYDGSYWRTYPLPNKTIVRSLVIGKDNKIYAGGQNDFGYFSPDKNGKLVYTSLKTLLSEKNSSFSDIWNIVSVGDGIFFMSREKIFQYTNKSITVYPAYSEWQFLGLSNNQLIAQDLKNGLLTFVNGVWSAFVKGSKLPKDFLVSAIFPLGKDSSFITTITSGFFILANNDITSFPVQGNNPFLKERILTCTPVNKDWIAVGTNLDGCYIMNKKGEIIQNLSRKEGLQLNNVLTLFIDKDNNLWMGLDNGIDFIAYNNSIKHIYPEKLNEGEGYSSIVYNNTLYVATSNGLYWVPVSNKNDLSFVNGEFQSINNTKGSSWVLNEIDDVLLFGHHDGVFRIVDNVATPIRTPVGYLSFLPLSNVLPSPLVLAGNTNGVDILEYKNKNFISTGNIPGFNERSQFMAIDNNNNLWIAHQYKGVYKIDLTDKDHPKISFYTEKNGLPSNIKNQLFKVKNRVVICTEKGVYEYNPITDAFNISPYFKTFFGERNIRHLKEDAEGNIWFVEEKNLGVVDFSGPKPETIYFPELNGKIVSGYEHINPYNRSNVFVGTEKGFCLINYEQYKKNKYKMQAQIRSVKTSGNTDSLIFGGYFGEVNEVLEQQQDAIQKIASNLNSVHFEYSSPATGHQNSVEYSHFLLGYDKDWSAWSKKTENEYTNLPPGNYTFQVKAKNNLINESTICSYSFTVLPSWYQTYWAYFFYALMVFVIVYVGYRWQKKKFLKQQEKHEEEQRQLQYMHQLELEKSENEITKLKNEKLKVEIEHKNTELASVAMHLVQKGELLANVKEEMGRLKKGTNGDKPPEDFKKIIRILDEENKMDKDWDHFAVHFDKVHSDFLRTVKAKFPSLSAHELKLCAYLVMNLSSKEIAQLMNISVRGVEISRYRLRKKFHLHTETNLFNFLLQFSASSSVDLD
jgi:ligand-binding sensor domain-containing protein/DNA-binding CsgD family transcriptional regulator